MLPEDRPEPLTYEEWCRGYEDWTQRENPDSYIEQAELLLVTQKADSSASEEDVSEEPSHP